MTSSKLIGASAAELEKFTDAQLLEYFKPVLHLTRPPAQAPKTQSTLDLKTVGGGSGNSGRGSSHANNMKIVEELMKKHNIKV